MLLKPWSWVSSVIFLSFSGGLSCSNDCNCECPSNIHMEHIHSLILKHDSFQEVGGQRNKFKNQLCKSHFGYLVSPFQSFNCLGPIISETFILHILFHSVFSNTKLVPHSSRRLFRFLASCSTNWRRSGLTVSSFTFFGVTTDFSWKFLCHFLISIPFRVRSLHLYFGLYSSWTLVRLLIAAYQRMESLLTPSDNNFLFFLSLQIAFSCIKIDRF